MKGVLLDTNVLIDYLRGKPGAVEYLENAVPPLYLSAITVAELYAGVRNRREREALGWFVDTFNIIAVDRDVAEKGGELRQRYAKSHNVDLIDALIAATSLLRSIPLATRNKKHFPMLEEVIVPYVE